MSASGNVFFWIMLFWGIVLIGTMAIGGFFMFRKFLKLLPKSDGRSKLDWQNYYVEQSRHLWTSESKEFLEKLVKPVPSPFRDIAKHSIAAMIGKVALDDRAREVTTDHCLKGYIMATPKRDHRSLIKFLEKNQIDYERYRHMLQ